MQIAKLIKLKMLTKIFFCLAALFAVAFSAEVLDDSNFEASVRCVRQVNSSLLAVHPASSWHIIFGSDACSSSCRIVDGHSLLQFCA